MITNKIRLLLVDDQNLIREGLRSLLEMYDDIEIVGEAGNGQEAIERVKQLHPDMLLMDIRMPVMDGVAATREIKSEFPESKIIILTTFDDDEYIIKAMTYGASGYLLKDTDSRKLVQAIRDGIEGNIILPGIVAAKITSRLSQGLCAEVQPGSKEINKNINHNDFSQRETDIIRLLIEGKSNRDISQMLFLSVGTTKNYISQIYMKLEISDRANAVLALKKLGF